MKYLGGIWFNREEWNGMKFNIWGYGFLIPKEGLKYGKPLSAVISDTRWSLKKSKQTLSMDLADSISILEFPYLSKRKAESNALFWHFALTAVILVSSFITVRCNQE